MQVCPRCGQKIPATDMAEHMRIELLDPKWREQHRQMSERLKEMGAMAEGVDVSKNLQTLAKRRTDIFAEEGDTAVRG